MKATILLWAGLAVALSGTQDKTYDLKLDPKPVKGHKSEQLEKTSMKMVMKVNGTPAGGMTDDKVFAAAEEILAVDADDRTKRRWTFSKATRLVEGKAVPYGFQGKTVTMTDAKGKAREFAVEGGGAISEEDLAGLKEAFDDAKVEGKPSGSELFAPPKPVKAGESWTSDVKKAVQTMFDEEMAAAIDPAKSKLGFTLKSVETRAGVEFGKIEGTMELAFTSFGPLKLDQPILMKFTVDLDACIDKKLPDGVMKMKGEMKGKSPATTDAGKIEIEMDMTMDMEKTVKTTK